jgi:molybdopterin synthase catalytic subunit
MLIEITSDPISPWRRLDAYQQASALTGKHGATAVFVGTMRDFNEGDAVTAMQLEHYPAMTEKYLHQIAEQAMQQWPLLDVLIVHRVGAVRPNDTIVLVAVWSAHRADAFDASRHLMEILKSQAPFWKQETLRSGATRWVEKNTPGTR